MLKKPSFVFNGINDDIVQLDVNDSPIVERSVGEFFVLNKCLDKFVGGNGRFLGKIGCCQTA